MDFKKLSQKNTAAAFGCHRKTIRRWHHAGMPVSSDGTYNLPVCIAWKIEQIEGDIGDIASVGVEAEESQRWLAEYRKERAAITKLDREIMEDRYILASEVEKVSLSVGLGVKGSLNAMVDRLTPVLSAEINSHEIRKTLMVEVNRTLGNLKRDWEWGEKEGLGTNAKGKTKVITA